MKNLLSKLRNSFERKIYYKKRKILGTKITLTMVVKNEENGFLPEVINSVRPYITNAIIIDDNSSDNTVNIIDSLLNGIPHKIYKNKKSLFATEYKLRTKQFKLARKEKPEWILTLDADEIFVVHNLEAFKKDLLNEDFDLLRYTLFDMWDENNFRSDKNWNGHIRPWPFLLRNQSKFHFYRWLKTNQHCGRFPGNVNFIGTFSKSCYVKHLGWSTEQRRKNKFERYKKLDDLNIEKYNKLYDSILDKNPNLINLEDYVKNNL